MGIKSQAGIYQILEDILRATKDPLTCVDIYDNNIAVKKLTDSPNDVSNYLGLMWRRGFVQRWHAPKDSRAKARYAYTWREEDTTRTEKIEPIAVVNSRVLGKPNVTITEDDGRIILDFPQFTLTVQSKG